jgi:hypothetical protein
MVHDPDADPVGAGGVEFGRARARRQDRESAVVDVVGGDGERQRPLPQPQAGSWSR